MDAKGEQVRLALIDPVCRQDFRCANRTALLRLLAEGDTPLALPEHFDRLTPDRQLAVFIDLARTAGIMAQNLTLQAAEAWIDNIAHLLRSPVSWSMPPGDPRAGRQRKSSGKPG